jgi:DNA-binding CsgD family transcriptional regulator
MLEGFVQNIMSCTTLDAVQGALRKEVARHGFANSAYRTVVPTASGIESRYVFRNWSKEWIQLSETKGFARSSFTATEARRRMMPFSWLDIRAARPFSPSEEECWNDMGDFGWRDGFVIPVHGPRGYLATVNMASREADLDLSPLQRLHLQMVALVVHERCRALSGAVTKSAFNGLSARELECLRWVAAGKTDWEIGKILSISAATAKFHVDRARTKLGARTRAEATARLVLSGLY